MKTGPSQLKESLFFNAERACRILESVIASGAPERDSPLEFNHSGDWQNFNRGMEQPGSSSGS
jgi:hypothetical protein